MSEEKKTCQAISHPNLAPGWVCCGDGKDDCHTYNGDARNECKFCGHARCGQQPTTKVIPYRKEDGSVALREIVVPQKTDKMN